MLIKKDPTQFASYLEDSSNLRGGNSDYVAIPETAAEISAILSESSAKGTPVTVSGAGTGTSGGRIPYGGIVLSTERLVRILDLHKTDSGGVIRSEAAVTVSRLKGEAEKAGFFYTYDPTEQSAFVGGTVATNASGARSFKYGSTRSSVTAIKAYLASGDMIDIRRGDVTAKNGMLEFTAGKHAYALRLPSYSMPPTKSSAGYYVKPGMDLVDLFIGQEGTLACIVEASFKLLPAPDDILSCYAFFGTDAAAIGFASEAAQRSMEKRGVSGSLDAMSLEYFDKASLDLLKEKYPQIPDAAAAVFFEQDIRGGGEDPVLSAWQALLEKYGVSAADTWIAMSESKRGTLIEIRHSIGEAMNTLAKRNGMPKVTTDLAVPRDKFPEMMAYYRKTLDGCGIRNFLFGHIGDCHMHMNLVPSSGEELERSRAIALDFVRKSIKLGGTVSAEHGVGKTRREYLKLLYGEAHMTEMFAIKKALDPGLILGRDNIF